MEDILEKYLYTSKLFVVGDTHDVRASLDNDEEALAGIAGMVRTYEPSLRRLLQARLQPIRDAIIAEIKPQELLIYREALVAVALVLDDAVYFEQKYAAIEKSKTEANAGKTDVLAAGEAPIIEDNVRDGKDLSSA